ncbi:uncharacterized protein LOC119178390 isoform X1 [Rhipicephalus microplus]|uniref:uncharacterized protein LOC119178390 isoform X1 n=1 Tax=Rhipicephalus microplus TaxID=6941 RepID=UPI003F6B3D7C
MKRKHSTTGEATAVICEEVHHEACYVAHALRPYSVNVVPASEVRASASFQENKEEAIVKAGRKLEALGHVLQGKVPESKADALRDVTDALEALATGGNALDKESSEYWVGVIIRGIAGGAVAHGIDKWRKRKG